MKGHPEFDTITETVSSNDNINTCQKELDSSGNTAATALTKESGNWIMEHQGIGFDEGGGFDDDFSFNSHERVDNVRGVDWLRSSDALTSIEESLRLQERREELRRTALRALTLDMSVTHHTATKRARSPRRAVTYHEKDALSKDALSRDVLSEGSLPNPNERSKSTKSMAKIMMVKKFVNFLSDGINSEDAKEFNRINKKNDGKASRVEIAEWVKTNPSMWGMLSVNLNLSESKCIEIASRVVIEVASNQSGEPQEQSQEQQQQQNALNNQEEEFINRKQFCDFKKNYVNDPKGSQEFFHRSVFAAYDDDNNGTIDKDEFENFVDIFYEAGSIFAGDARLPEKEKLKKIAYEKLDTNGDGLFSFEEIRSLISGSAFKSITSSEFCPTNKVDVVKEDSSLEADIKTTTTEIAEDDVEEDPFPEIRQSKRTKPRKYKYAEGPRLREYKYVERPPRLPEKEEYKEQLGEEGYEESYEEDEYEEDMSDSFVITTDCRDNSLMSDISCDYPAGNCDSQSDLLGRRSGKMNLDDFFENKKKARKRKKLKANRTGRHFMDEEYKDIHENYETLNIRPYMSEPYIINEESDNSEQREQGLESRPCTSESQIAGEHFLEMKNRTSRVQFSPETTEIQFLDLELDEKDQNYDGLKVSLYTSEPYIASDQSDDSNHEEKAIETYASEAQMKDKEFDNIDKNFAAMLSMGEATSAAAPADPIPRKIKLVGVDISAIEKHKVTFVDIDDSAREFASLDGGSIDSNNVRCDAGVPYLSRGTRNCRIHNFDLMMLHNYRLRRMDTAEALIRDIYRIKKKKKKKARKRTHLSGALNGKSDELILGELSLRESSQRSLTTRTTSINTGSNDFVMNSFFGSMHRMQNKSHWKDFIKRRERERFWRRNLVQENAQQKLRMTEIMEAQSLGIPKYLYEGRRNVAKDLNKKKVKKNVQKKQLTEEEVAQMRVSQPQKTAHQIVQLGLSVF